MSVKKGESLTLPDLGECGHDGIAVWHSYEGGIRETVGENGESYTPMADITLYAGCPQE